MKKFVSLTLACLLVLVSLASLGGCGKDHGKEVFTDAADNEYYSALVNAFTAPIADIDSETFLGDRENKPDFTPVTEKITFTLTGLDSISKIINTDLGDELKVSASGVTDGEAVSGKLELGILRETLVALFSLDGEKLALLLPDLSDRPFATDALPEQSPEKVNELFSIAEQIKDSFKIDADEEISELKRIIGPKTAALADDYIKFFFENISDSHYKEGSDNFRTADGEKELPCTELYVDGSDISAAIAKTAEKLSADKEVDKLLGENGKLVRRSAEILFDAIEKNINNEAINEALAKNSLRWVRFYDDVIVGDRLTVAAGDLKCTFELGVSEGADRTLAFFTVRDETRNAPLMNAESSVSDDSATLKIEFNMGGASYSLIVDGKTEEVDGASVTTADVKVNANAVSIKLFTLKTTVRKFEEENVDVSAELTLNPTPELMNISLGIKFDFELHEDPDAKVNIIDASNAITDVEISDEDFAKKLLYNFGKAHPHILETLVRGIVEAQKAFSSFADNMPSFSDVPDMPDLPTITIPSF